MVHQQSLPFSDHALVSASQGLPRPPGLPRNCPGAEHQSQRQHISQTPVRKNSSKASQEPQKNGKPTLAHSRRPKARRTSKSPFLLSDSSCLLNSRRHLCPQWSRSTHSHHSNYENFDTLTLFCARRNLDPAISGNGKFALTARLCSVWRVHHRYLCR